MADTDYCPRPQKLRSPLLPPNPPNPSKIYTHFMYKAAIFAIFLVILPFFPSQAPEFINQSLHTRSWELVQLILVGIAVSYGLFSRKNDETEKEQSSKFENAQSYVSRLLQVSSVFDDESDSPSGSDENKVQTWNSQYFRGEPVVVVAQENSPVLDDEEGGSAFRVDKPLLLPVRSLKSRVAQPDCSETVHESSGKGGSLSRSNSNSGSKRFSNGSNKSRNGEFGGSIPLDLEGKAEDNVVLRSPIPWRSRSGRMELKEESDGEIPLYSLPPSMEESDFNRFRSQSKPNSTSPSQSKNVEEIPRSKIYYKSSPPPAPPPPPPPPPLSVRKSPLVKSNSTLSNPAVLSVKELRRSVRSVPTELGGNETGERQSRANSGAESRPRVQNESTMTGKSVRSIRPGEPIRETMPFVSKAGYVDYEGEEREEFEDNRAAETEEESEIEEDEDLFEGGSENGKEEEEEVGSNKASDGGKDVNKKADEFIAKFREQIRLQRIESIKRSTGQVARKSTR